MLEKVGGRVVEILKLCVTNYFFQIFTFPTNTKRTVVFAGEVRSRNFPCERDIVGFSFSRDRTKEIRFLFLNRFVPSKKIRRYENIFFDQINILGVRLVGFLLSGQHIITIAVESIFRTNHRLQTVPKSALPVI